MGAGGLLFGWGVLGVWGALELDTTVPAGGGGRVHNIGLIQGQRNGVIVSITVAALGFVLTVICYLRPRAGSHDD